MPSAVRAQVVLGLLGILCLPAIAQDSDINVVRDTASPSLNLKPKPNTKTEPIECLAPRTRLTVTENIPYCRGVHQ